MGNQFQLSFPGMPTPQPKQQSAPQQPKEKSWSGPIPGQTVMHPQDLGRLNRGITSLEHLEGADSFSAQKRFLEADQHGVVQQTTSNADPDPDISTARLFLSHGGGADKPGVKDFWDKQPVHSVNADTPVHSTQSHRDTENSGSVERIRRELSSGAKIENPAWLVKDKGRLFVLDGHHRIAAARQAGRKNFPARVWDRDKALGE